MIKNAEILRDEISRVQKSLLGVDNQSGVFDQFADYYDFSRLFFILGRAFSRLWNLLSRISDLDFHESSVLAGSFQARDFSSSRDFLGPQIRRLFGDFHPVFFVSRPPREHRPRAAVAVGLSQSERPHSQSGHSVSPSVGAPSQS